MRKMIILLATACLFLAASGCVVSKNTEKFQEQVKKWVPIGMKVSKAQHVMEKKGFECNVVPHGSVLNTTNDVDWLECSREQIWFHDWNARILLKDDKVVGYGPAQVK